MWLEISTIIIVILSAAIMDRVRGDSFNIINRAFEKIIYGWIIATALNHPFDWMTPLIAIGFMLGVSTGWGSVVGRLVHPESWDNSYETWQIGPLRDNLYLAATLRGAFFCTPFSLLAWYDPQLLWAIPAFAIAFPLSIYLSILIVSDGRENHGNKRWELSEYLRGGIGAGLCMALPYLFK